MKQIVQRSILVIFLGLAGITTRAYAQSYPYWDPNLQSPFSCSDYYGLWGPLASTNGVVYTLRFNYYTGWMSVYRWSKYGGWQDIGDMNGIGYGGPGGQPGAICIHSNYLFVGGLFTQVWTNGVEQFSTSTSLAKYDLVNRTWSAVSGSLTGEVCAITFDKTGNMYVGQPDTSDGTHCLQKWNGSAWSTVPGFSNVNCVNALTSDGTNIYVGATFYSLTAYVMEWCPPTSTWYQMGAGATEGIPLEAGPVVYSLLLQGTNLFSAGIFSTVGGEASTDPSAIPTSGLYRYSTISRQRLSFVNLCDYSGGYYSSVAGGSGLALLGNTLYVSGGFNAIYDFSTASVTFCTNIAKWDGSNWAPLGTGLDSVPYYDAAYLASGTNAIFASGPFCYAGSVDSEEIARWVTAPDPAATITTVVGDHSRGGTYYGDGGSPLNAGLSGPVGITIYHGNLIIADTYNSAVREVWNLGQPGSYITSPYQPPYQYQRNYFISPVGVAVDSNGYLYVADADNGGILQFQSWNQPPNDLGGGFFAPLSLVLAGAGTLYFSDEWVNTVNQIDTSGNNLTTVAGTGVPGYFGDNGPATSAQVHVDSYYSPTGYATVTSGVTVDSYGNLYIADMGNNVIRKVDTGGTITTVAGTGTVGYSGDGGPATSAQLNHPAAVAVDSQGNLYIADAGNNRIRRVDHQTGNIATVAGNGTAGYSGDGGSAMSAELYAPGGLTFDTSGNLYISDSANDVIRKLTSLSSLP